VKAPRDGRSSSAAVPRGRSRRRHRAVEAVVALALVARQIRPRLVAEQKAADQRERKDARVEVEREEPHVEEDAVDALAQLAQRRPDHRWAVRHALARKLTRKLEQLQRRAVSGRDGSGRGCRCWCGVSDER